MKANIAAETSAREAADSALQSSIAAETSAREVAIQETKDGLQGLNVTLGNQINEASNKLGDQLETLAKNVDKRFKNKASKTKVNGLEDAIAALTSRIDALEEKA